VPCSDKATLSTMDQPRSTKSAPDSASPPTSRGPATDNGEPGTLQGGAVSVRTVLALKASPEFEKSLHLAVLG
jgi:hypothetical protein